MWERTMGLIQVTEEVGKLAQDRELPGCTRYDLVSRIAASQHDGDTVYAAFENHKRSDFAPYLLKSTDRGKSWTSIKSNLRQTVRCYAIAEDHVNPNLLFVGTEFGFSSQFDGGQKWVQLKGGMRLFRFAISLSKSAENDLVLRTFRSQYLHSRQLHASSRAETRNA
jgi:photosystem II stability/assembly factor-like uncharacterized protein